MSPTHHVFGSTTLTCSSEPIGQRGDYIYHRAPDTTPIIGASITPDVFQSHISRVTHATTTTLTTRPTRRWRWLEWLNARAEDWIVWPLADLRARFRLRVR